MITLHHLNNSRSQRILWLLEELELPYALETHQRDAVTNLAPASLIARHPLGKSPMIEDDGRVITESGAIVEYLCAKHGPHMVPTRESAAYVSHLELMHCCGRLGDDTDPAQPLHKQAGRGRRATGATHCAAAGKPFHLYGNSASAIRPFRAGRAVGGGHHAELSC